MQVPQVTKVAGRYNVIRIPKLEFSVHVILGFLFTFKRNLRTWQCSFQAETCAYGYRENIINNIYFVVDKFNDHELDVRWNYE